MSKIHEIYVRNIRDQLGRYPNWPVNQPMDLGMIGYYNGRQATFDWITTLKDIGINVAPTPLQALMSELYTTMNSVSYNFSGDAINGNVRAEFYFSKKRSVASQGHDVGYQTLPLDKLKVELLKKINNQFEWDYDYVIVTELWKAAGFTTLISASKDSSSEISAKNLGANKIFNVADHSLGLQVTKFKQMAYQGVAEQSVQPYFQIHRLTKDHKLKRYGANTFSFN